MNETAALPVWTCEFTKSPDEGAHPMDNLTVGSKFVASCKGDIPVTWGEGKLQTVFAKKEEDFTLVVLNAEKLDTNAAVLTVTSYKAGQHAPEYIRFMQGQSGFEVLKPTWEIKSVLKPNEQAQPYAPFGPWGVSLPMWFFLIALFLFALTGFLVVRKARKVVQRRRMLEELARHKTALTPINQFYRDARQLRRRLNEAKNEEQLKSITDDLNREFRLYVLRQFQIPTLDWSDRAIVEDLRKRHNKVYKHAADPLKRTLRELALMKTRPHVLLPDVEQLHRMSLDAAERIEGARGGHK